MATDRPDDAARRAYWAEQMDAAYAFMETICTYPVAECGEPLAPLQEAAGEAGVEVAFATDQLAGRFNHVFCLREGLAGPFVAAAREINDRGWMLRVEDGYRTRAMQKYLGHAPGIFDVILERVQWELAGRTPDPEMMFRRVSALVATRPKIGTHMSGSAMDISVLSRDDGAEIARGAPYLDLSELTPMASPFVDDQARRNRDEITALMARHGFMAYPYEFWHYSMGDAYAEHLTRSGEPGRYGAVDADVATGRVEPIADPVEPLHTMPEVRAAIDGALKRGEG